MNLPPLPIDSKMEQWIEGVMGLLSDCDEFISLWSAGPRDEQQVLIGRIHSVQREWLASPAPAAQEDSDGQ